MNQNANAGVGDTPAAIKPSSTQKYKATSRNSSINIKEVAFYALQNAEDVVNHFAPGGKRKGDEYVVRNPTRPDSKAGSFKINLRTGRWSDFAINKRGGDFVDWVAYLTGLTQFEAAKTLSKILGLSKSDVATVAAVDTFPKGLQAGALPSGGCVNGASKPSVNAVARGQLNAWLPIPQSAPPPPAHPKRGQPNNIYPYCTAEGEIVHYACRFNSETSKSFLPLTYDDGWQWKLNDAPRPLYHLDKLTKRVGARLVLVEGEGKADKAQSLLPDDFVVTTTMNGAQSASKADWSVVRDRDLTFWRDNDEPGLKYQDACIELARKNGARSIKVVHVDRIVVDGKPLRHKWDLKDVDEIDWTGADVLKVLNDSALTETVYERPKQEFSWKEDIKSNESFECNETGVYYIPACEPGEELKKFRISSPVWIEAAVRNADGVNWGRALVILDPLGNRHKYTMPMSMLSGSCEELRAILLSLGVEFEPGIKAKNLFITYLQIAKPKKIARCVSKIGWYGKAFVFPEETYGSLDSEESVYFQPEGECKHGLEQKGSLDDWRAHVAPLCVGNSRLMFSLCVSLAAPLFHLVDEENGGFHLRGSSSIGKSTALFLSASAYGGKGFIGTWRSTSNGMEATAVAHNDIVLLLDELAQVDPAHAGEVAYLLGNSQTKQRAGRSGAARRTASFRSLFLSTGEISLADHMAVAGRKSHAGQEVRVIDIPADAGAGLGLFENLHGAANGDEFARSIKEVSEKYHGTAGVAFIQELAAADDNLPALIRRLRDLFVKEYLQEPASGQARRVAGRFGLVAAAGELATKFGITGWKEGDAADAVAQCFNAWLEARGGTGSIEPKAILSQVRFFFEQHGESRFSTFKEEPDRVTIHRAGFKKLDDAGNKLEFFVLPETFKNEICKGLDSKAVAKLLVENGWLLPGSDGNTSRVERLPGVGRLRCYRFTSKVLGDGD